MARRLETELKEVGCDMSAAEFREMLEEKKALSTPAWTIDDLVCHPIEARQFCDMVRQISTCEKLDDAVILRTLMNARKSH